MKTIMQTGIIAFLLLFAVSCQKDDANSTRSVANTTSSAQSGAGAEQENLLGLVSPVGNWTWYYSWGCTGGYNATWLSIYADGTWASGEGYTGKWVDGRGIFILIFDEQFGGRTTYSGTERISSIKGIMSTFNNFQGCFYFEQNQTDLKSFKSVHVQGTPNALGKAVTN